MRALHHPWHRPKFTAPRQQLLIHARAPGATPVSRRFLGLADEVAQDLEKEEEKDAGQPERVSEEDAPDTGNVRRRAGSCVASPVSLRSPSCLDSCGFTPEGIVPQVLTLEEYEQKLAK